MSLRYFNAAGADPDGELGGGARPRDATSFPGHRRRPGHARSAQGLSGRTTRPPTAPAWRDYVHVADLARAHILALEHLGAGGAPGSLNLGTGRGIPCGEVAGRRGGRARAPRCPTRPRRAARGDPGLLVGRRRAGPRGAGLGAGVHDMDATSSPRPGAGTPRRPSPADAATGRDSAMRIVVVNQRTMARTSGSWANGAGTAPGARAAQRARRLAEHGRDAAWPELLLEVSACCRAPFSMAWAICLPPSSSGPRRASQFLVAPFYARQFDAVLCSQLPWVRAAGGPGRRAGVPTCRGSARSGPGGPGRRAGGPCASWPA